MSKMPWRILYFTLPFLILLSHLSHYLIILLSHYPIIWFFFYHLIIIIIVIIVVVTIMTIDHESLLLPLLLLLLFAFLVFILISFLWLTLQYFNTLVVVLLCINLLRIFAQDLSCNSPLSPSAKLAPTALTFLWHRYPAEFALSESGSRNWC